MAKKILNIFHMKKWYEFIQILETEGGAIFVLFVLILLFCALALCGMDDAKAQIPIILGALIGILKGKMGNNDKV